MDNQPSTMTKEFRKRPFARPLFLWVIGICWAVYLPSQWIVCSLCLLMFCLVSSMWFCKSGDYPLYEHRWCWGFAFSSLFFVLAIEYTLYRLRLPVSMEIPIWQQLCKAWQAELLRALDVLDLSDSDKSVLATLTLGYRQHMEWSVRQRFSLAGAAHILAISGFHIGVVYSFFRSCLFFLPDHSRIRYLKNGLLLIMVWIFVSLTGLAASAVRAALMISFYLVGRMLRRHSESYNTWSAAAFCMLVYNPFYLFDIGFELSFLAVLSILFFYHRFQAYIKLKNPGVRSVWSWLTISISAQIGTIPLSLYYFGEVSSVALLTALPVTLFSILIIPTALLWILLYQFGIDWTFLAHVVTFLTSSFCLFIDRLGRVPAFAVSFPFTSLMLFSLYIILFSFCLYIRQRTARSLIWMLGLILLFSLYVLYHKYVALVD